MVGRNWSIQMLTGSVKGYVGKVVSWIWTLFPKFLVKLSCIFGIFWRFKALQKDMVNGKLNRSLKATKWFAKKQWKYAIRNIWKGLLPRPGIEPGSLRFSLQVLYPLSYRSCLLKLVPVKADTLHFQLLDVGLETDQFRCLLEVLRDMWGR